MKFNGICKYRFSLSWTLGYVILMSIAASPLNDGYAFTVAIHSETTRTQLADIKVTIDGRQVSFSQKALEEIVAGNVETDDEPNQAIDRPEFHFTNERYEASMTHLNDSIDAVIELVTKENPDGAQARERLGRAIHTVQDFYAHSNWVEQGKTQSFPDTLSGPDQTSQPCPSNPNSLGAGGGGSDTSGYFIGGFKLTDPYTLGCRNLPRMGKCWHGNYLTDCGGINKDYATKQEALNSVRAALGAGGKLIGLDRISPPSGSHGSAVTLAKQHTLEFVTEKILLPLAGNNKALLALLDVRGTISFLVDDTGSMGEEIGDVKIGINRLAETIDADPERTPSGWQLVRFGDPDVGPAFLTSEVSALQDAVSSLVPFGGGDCPELSQGALGLALDNAFPGGVAFLFTDASAKDSSGVNSVIRRAQEKNVRLNYALTGTCSPIDEAYVRGAEETGGQLLFVDGTEIDKVFDLIEPQMSGNLGTILFQKGDLSSGVETSEFPVDSTVRRLIVSVSVLDSGNISSVVLRDPDGNVVEDSSGDVNIATLSTAAIITVEAPQQGSWTVGHTGAGEATVHAQAESMIDFLRFRFVAPSLDVHGGYTSIPGLPIVGADIVGEGILLGDVSNVQFGLVDLNGDQIQSLELTNNFPSADPDHFLGAVSLPLQPFRVGVVGQDADGELFQRIYAPVFEPKFVGVTVDAFNDNAVAPGTTKTIKFIVNNLGDLGLFRLGASVELGTITSISPLTTTIDSGSSDTFDVQVRVPEDVPDGTIVKVIATATKEVDETEFNSATVKLLVVEKRNSSPDCEGASPSVVSIWPSNHKFTSVGILGVSDPDGDPLTVSINSILQDEPVVGAGSGRTYPDGKGVGTSIAEIRAERSGKGDGRAYHIAFSVDDGNGGSCNGEVLVSVPHDKKGSARDGGALHDSTTP